MKCLKFKRAFCSEAKRVIGISMLALSLIVVFSCVGKQPVQPDTKIMKGVINRVGAISFVDVNTGNTLSYSKLIFDGKEIDKVFEAVPFPGTTLGIAVSYREYTPPNEEPAEYTRVLGHDPILKYKLEAGVLTILSVEKK